MNSDLKLIKDKYGEDMMHFCRRIFPTIMEQSGLLFKLLSENFEYSKSLYKDIVDNEMTDEFKDYIMCLARLDECYKDADYDKSPKELLETVGYDLYECKTEEDINAFAKYYAPGERICTFGDNRLKDSYVFFAVKKNANKIKREDFLSPARQDKYGTSVISIQFTKGEVNTLGIMNRYNHAVKNSDATFSNNLDNIVPGLTRAFAREYGLNIYSNRSGFDMPNYVRAMDGKYYKYNFMKNNNYYCPNNVIIDSRYNAHKFDKEKYIIMDYYIIDLVNKEVRLFDQNIIDSFIDGFKDIKNIKVLNDKEKNIKKITIDDEIELVINKDNRLIKYHNPHVRKLDNSFYGCRSDSLIEVLDLPNVLTIENDFFEGNKGLKEIRLDNVMTIEDYFLRKNQSLKEIYAPNAIYIGNGFLENNNTLRKIELPNVLEVGDDFLTNCRDLEKISLDSLRKIGNNFLAGNNSILIISLPFVEEIKNGFMLYSSRIKKVVLPNVRVIGNSFMNCFDSLEEIHIPNVLSIGDRFLRFDNSLKKFDAPNLITMGNECLSSNNLITSLNLPHIKKIGNEFMNTNFVLESLFAPSLEEVGTDFISNAMNIKTIHIPNLKEEYVGNLGKEVLNVLRDKNAVKKRLIRRYF